MTCLCVTARLSFRQGFPSILGWKQVKFTHFFPREKYLIRIYPFPSLCLLFAVVDQEFFIAGDFSSVYRGCKSCSETIVTMSKAVTGNDLWRTYCVALSQSPIELINIG